ncbi:hypothetical protein IWZ03DRAFT_416677 [Phyllosticta citriasiana]|uniref:Uncharacterized protein n=1 Tax=Phyllosticta citriasiana TaxID=595635 RepID=A0ABR1KJ68_9PEZI
MARYRRSRNNSDNNGNNSTNSNYGNNGNNGSNRQQNSQQQQNNQQQNNQQQRNSQQQWNNQRQNNHAQNDQYGDQGQNIGSRRNNRNNPDNQQNYGQPSQFDPNWTSPHYKGNNPHHRNGNNNNNNNANANDNNNTSNNNGPQNNQEGRQRQRQNGNAPNSAQFADPQQQALHASWQRQQDDQRRRMVAEASELLQKEQRDFLASQVTPSAETILAFEAVKNLFRTQITRNLSASEAADKMQALQLVQSHFIQRPHPDDTTQPLLSTLVGYVVSWPTTVITDPQLIDRLGTTLDELETKLVLSVSQLSDGGLELLSGIQNNSEALRTPILTKQPGPPKQQYQTNNHVEDLLRRFDAWLKENGLTAVRVTSDSVYYRYTEPVEGPGYVRLEGHTNMAVDAATLRAAEHAYILWSAERQANEAVTSIKAATKSVLHNVARVHPEARKQLETFEKGLEAERAQVHHREMQAQLNFERQQREHLQRLEEHLEEQRRVFFGIDAGGNKQTKRAYIAPPTTTSIPAEANIGSRPDYASRLFSGLKTPVKPVDPTVPLAVKKPRDEKKQQFYPRFLHGSSLFRVENAAQTSPKVPAIKAGVIITLTTPSPTKTRCVLLRTCAGVSAPKAVKKVSFQAQPKARVDAVERWIEDAKTAGQGQGPWTEADSSDEEPTQKERGLAWGDVHPKKLFGEEGEDWSVLGETW